MRLTLNDVTSMMEALSKVEDDLSFDVSCQLNSFLMFEVMHCNKKQEFLKFKFMDDQVKFSHLENDGNFGFNVLNEFELEFFNWVDSVQLIKNKIEEQK